MDKTWEYLYATFDAAIKSSVPISSVRPKFRNVYTNREVLRLRKKKMMLWRNYCNTHCTLDYNRFARACNELCSMIRNLKSDYEESLENKIKSNPKAFWKYVNSKLKLGYLWIL